MCIFEMSKNETSFLDMSILNKVVKQNDISKLQNTDTFISIRHDYSILKSNLA